MSTKKEVRKEEGKNNSQPKSNKKGENKGKNKEKTSKKRVISVTTKDNNKTMSHERPYYKVVKMGKITQFNPILTNKKNKKQMTRVTFDTNDTNDTLKSSSVSKVSKVLCDMKVLEISEKSPNEIKVKVLEIIGERGLKEEMIASIIAKGRSLSYDDFNSELDSSKSTIRKTLQRRKELFKVEDKDGNRKLWGLSDKAINYIKEKAKIYKKIQENKKEKQRKKERKRKKEEQLYNEICKIKEEVPPERKGIKSLYWNVGEILEFNEDIAKTLLENPEKFIEMLDEVYVENYDHRFYNLPKDRVLNAEQVRKEHINELIEIRGRIVSLSSVRPVIEKAKYECPSCGTRIIVECGNSRTLRKPNRCSCGKKRGFKLIGKKRVDRANLIIEDIHEQSENPHTERLKAFVKEDLTSTKQMSTFYPGNEVKAVGIVREKPIYKNGKESTQVDLNLEVMQAENTQEEISIDSIEEEELNRIKEIANNIDENGIEEISKSFAPSIYGYDEIKKALILQICNRRNEHKKDSVRNKSNILLMGDPGVGKSVLGEFAVRVSPGGRRGAGGTASTVGLTASVVKEDDDLGGWRVEPGAYALAKDLFFLDELNNIGEEEEQSRLQEGMSEQIITVDKANVHAELKIYSGLLAAANPIGGHFNTEQNYVEQFDIPSPILNRFDTIFVMKDKVDKEKDLGIARKMIRRENKDIECKYNEDILKKFFVYAKSIEKPVMTEEVKNMLEEIYQGERVNSRTKDLIINPRLLESLIRMIKASARTRLSEKIEKKDVRRALNILSKSQYKVSEYEKFKENKESKEIDKKVKGIKEVIDEKYNKYGKTIPKEEIYQEGFSEEELNKLMQNGEIIEPREGYIQRI